MYVFKKSFNSTVNFHLNICMGKKTCSELKIESNKAALFQFNNF